MIQPVLMNFSGVYEEEKFYRKFSGELLSLRTLEGTNCYCTPEAEEQIKAWIEKYPVRGIHFLDSGNYHYVTKFWIDRMQVPFDLLVFDNHTDMQEAAFFGLLSCGSWVRASLEQNPFLRQVCVVGPPRASVEELQDDKGELSKRVTFVTREDLQEGKTEAYRVFLRENNQPLYLSVDKDVLRKEDAATNWDQGEMTLCELLNMTEEIRQFREIAGIDICGEGATAEGIWNPEEVRINEKTNAILLEKTGCQIDRNVVV